jgi:PPK2 family polyphosphate:nucleotide phosphotransferase
VKFESKDFRVRNHGNVKLKSWSTAVKPMYESQDQYHVILNKQVAELSRLQNLHYASNRNALLIVIQGMDAAGKDGTIKHVMSGVNPQGCQVFSFKQPTAEDLEHDFLWRTTLRLPEKGKIGIFNRSYYEEVLIDRVHPEILKAEKIENDVYQPGGRNHFWKERYRSIVENEKHLHRNGTQIVKIFLHLSLEEQRKRFLERINDPEKNWKLSLADIRERDYWKKYMTAYEECLSHTSSKSAPWYVVPADDKLNTRLIVSQIILERLGDLKMEYPKIDTNRRKELGLIRKCLMAQEKSHAKSKGHST